MKLHWQIEYILAAGFVLLVPVFMLGVLATWFEHALGLTAAFAGFGMAGVVWIRHELQPALARLGERLGLVPPPPVG